MQPDLHRGTEFDASLSEFVLMLVQTDVSVARSLRVTGRWTTYMATGAESLAAVTLRAAQAHWRAPAATKPATRKRICSPPSDSPSRWLTPVALWASGRFYQGSLQGKLSGYERVFTPTGSKKRFRGKPARSHETKRRAAKRSSDLYP